MPTNCGARISGAGRCLGQAEAGHASPPPSANRGGPRPPAPRRRAPHTRRRRRRRRPARRRQGQDPPHRPLSSSSATGHSHSRQRDQPGPLRPGRAAGQPSRIRRQHGPPQPSSRQRRWHWRAKAAGQAKPIARAANTTSGKGRAKTNSAAKAAAAVTRAAGQGKARRATRTSACSTRAKSGTAKTEKHRTDRRHRTETEIEGRQQQHHRLPPAGGTAARRPGPLHPMHQPAEVDGQLLRFRPRQRQAERFQRLQEPPFRYPAPLLHHLSVHQGDLRRRPAEGKQADAQPDAQRLRRRRQRHGRDVGGRWRPVGHQRGGRERHIPISGSPAPARPRLALAHGGGDAVGCEGWGFRDGARRGDGREAAWECPLGHQLGAVRKHQDVLRRGCAPGCLAYVGAGTEGRRWRQATGG